MKKFLGNTAISISADVNLKGSYSQWGAMIIYDQCFRIRISPVHNNRFLKLFDAVGNWLANHFDHRESSQNSVLQGARIKVIFFLYVSGCRLMQMAIRAIFV